VWAGKGKLWLERPEIRVWQLKDPDFLLEDIRKCNPVHNGVTSRTIAVLKDLREKMRR
jgi:hypothetical protein